MSDHHQARDGSKRMTYRHAANHPARWSARVLEEISRVRAKIELPLGALGLDPFAGVGIREVAQVMGEDMIGVEIETPWARGEVSRGDEVGQELRAGNAGRYKFQQEMYKNINFDVWLECRRVMREGSWLILNVSDSMVKEDRVQVSEWHLDTLKGMGYDLKVVRLAPTPRMRFGAGGENRVPAEYVMLFQG